MNKMDTTWYLWALKTKQIDYWNFNCFLFPNFMRRYKLVCARTKRIAAWLGLRRVRKFRDGFWYGVLSPTKEKRQCAR